MVLLLLSDRDPLSHAGLGIFHAFARGPYSKCNKDDGKQIQSRKTSLNGKNKGSRLTTWGLGGRSLSVATMLEAQVMCPLPDDSGLQ